MVLKKSFVIGMVSALWSSMAALPVNAMWEDPNIGARTMRVPMGSLVENEQGGVGTTRGFFTSLIPYSAEGIKACKANAKSIEEKIDSLLSSFHVTILPEVEEEFRVDIERAKKAIENAKLDVSIYNRDEFDRYSTNQWDGYRKIKAEEQLQWLKVNSSLLVGASEEHASFSPSLFVATDPETTEENLRTWTNPTYVRTFDYTNDRGEKLRKDT